jgi:hypothetical protein
MRRNLVALALLVLAGTGARAADCIETLRSDSTQPLPMPAFAHARSVAWMDGATLLIGTQGGVRAYRIADGSSRVVVSGAAAPNGIPEVENLDSDGRTLAAYNADYTDLTAALPTGKILAAHRYPVIQVCDLAVHGGTTVVLGPKHPKLLQADRFGALWIGKAGDPFDKFRLLHPMGGAAETVFRRALFPYGGAVVIRSDETIAFITPAEPGIFQYRPDGQALPRLAPQLQELMVPRLPEAISKYAMDLKGRYEQIYNRQRSADDLVDTANGLAIVVRAAEGARVWWELWFPDASGIRRRIRLSPEQNRPTGGHLRCEARGNLIACITPMYAGPNTAGPPDLLMFNLDHSVPCH